MSEMTITIMLPLRSAQVEVLRRILRLAMTSAPLEELMILTELLQRLEQVVPLIGCKNVL